MPAVPEDERVAGQRERVGEGKDDGRPARFAVGGQHMLAEQGLVARVDLVFEGEGGDAAEGADGFGGPFGGFGEDL